MAASTSKAPDDRARATLQRVTPERIRAAMFGTPVPGVQMVRQAWRVSDTDSDELALLRVRGEWWVARRVSASFVIWAHRASRRPTSASTASSPTTPARPAPGPRPRHPLAG